MMALRFMNLGRKALLPAPQKINLFFNQGILDLLTRTITLTEFGLRITAVDKQSTLDLHLDNLQLGSQIFFLFHFLLSLFVLSFLLKTKPTRTL